MAPSERSGPLPDPARRSRLLVLHEARGHRQGVEELPGLLVRQGHAHPRPRERRGVHAHQHGPAGTHASAQPRQQRLPPADDRCARRQDPRGRSRDPRQRRSQGRVRLRHRDRRRASVDRHLRAGRCAAGGSPQDLQLEQHADRHRRRPRVFTGDGGCSEGVLGSEPVRELARGAAPSRTARGSGLSDRQRGGRRGQARRPRDLGVLRRADDRRQRNDAEPHRRGDACAVRAPRSSRAAEGTAGPVPAHGGRDVALRVSGELLPSHGNAGLRAARQADQGRREVRALVHVGEP